MEYWLAVQNVYEYLFHAIPVQTAFPWLHTLRRSVHKLPDLLMAILRRKQPKVALLAMIS